MSNNYYFIYVCNNYNNNILKTINFRYNGAGPTELWQTFDYVLFDSNYIIDEDIMVNNTMYLWTEQSGYPLINISEINGSIIATQVKTINCLIKKIV